MFLTLDSWHRAPEIIKMASIGAAPREASGKNAGAEGAP